MVGTELTVRGSNVGTRADLAEAIAFAANGLVTAKIERQPLGRVNQVLDRMRKGKILGRVVLTWRHEKPPPFRDGGLLFPRLSAAEY